MINGEKFEIKRISGVSKELGERHEDELRKSVEKRYREIFAFEREVERMEEDIRRLKGHANRLVAALQENIPMVELEKTLGNLAKKYGGKKNENAEVQAEVTNAQESLRGEIQAASTLHKIQKEGKNAINMIHAQTQVLSTLANNIRSQTGFKDGNAKVWGLENEGPKATQLLKCDYFSWSSRLINRSFTYAAKGLKLPFTGAKKIFRSGFKLINSVTGAGGSAAQRAAALKQS
jgi:predicted RNase H-like nuclease (RuvC/YqgF family)